MKRKSPKNYRRKKRATARKYLETSTWLDTGATLYYDGSPNTITTTVNFPTSSFSGSGFIAGDVISISGCAEPKRSKKVHVARRRIPKRSNNGGWMITSVDSDSSISIADLNNSTVTGDWTFKAALNDWPSVVKKDENDR